MPPAFDAVILDVDGVLTDTADKHLRAWKRLFEDVFAAHGDPAPFTPAEYRRHVDGRPRTEGLSAALAARGLVLPAPEREALAARKDTIYQDLLRAEGVRAWPDAVRALQAWRAAGLRIAFVSASRSAGRVLELAGLAPLGDVRVDGQTAAERGLGDKRALFAEAAREVGVPPARAIAVEDAAAGVAAARDLGFGRVVGVDRTGAAGALLAAHADQVVRSLDELVAPA
jgi:HAD superfamily hydrolase (TIGR01509 family)